MPAQASSTVHHLRVTGATGFTEGLSGNALRERCSHHQYPYRCLPLCHSLHHLYLDLHCHHLHLRALPCLPLQHKTTDKYSSTHRRLQNCDEDTNKYGSCDQQQVPQIRPQVRFTTHKACWKSTHNGNGRFMQIQNLNAATHLLWTRSDCARAPQHAYRCCSQRHVSCLHQ